MSTPTTAEVAAMLISRERTCAQVRMEGLQTDLNDIMAREHTPLRSHHVRSLIEAAQEIHRYLIRIEALEELKP